METLINLTLQRLEDLLSLPDNEFEPLDLDWFTASCWNRSGDYSGYQKFKIEFFSLLGDDRVSLIRSKRKEFIRKINLTRQNN